MRKALAALGLSLPLCLAACGAAQPPVAVAPTAVAPRVAVAAPVPATAPAPVPISEDDLVGEGGQVLPFETTRPRLTDLVLSLTFPKEADRKKINEATLTLRLLVTEQGEPRDIVVVRGDAMFAQATVDAIATKRFVPAKLHGKPVAATMHLKVTYKR